MGWQWKCDRWTDQKGPGSYLFTYREGPLADPERIMIFDHAPERRSGTEPIPAKWTRGWRPIWHPVWQCRPKRNTWEHSWTRLRGGRGDLKCGACTHRGRCKDEARVASPQMGSSDILSGFCVGAAHAEQRTGPGLAIYRSHTYPRTPPGSSTSALARRRPGTIDWTMLPIMTPRRARGGTRLWIKTT